MSDILRDSTGKTSSGRLQTTASVFVGLGLAITLVAGEWQGKTFSENVYILTSALTIGGAGMKGLQKFSERAAKRTAVADEATASPPTVAASATETAPPPTKVIKVQTPEKELTAVLQEGW